MKLRASSHRTDHLPSARPSRPHASHFTADRGAKPPSWKLMRFLIGEKAASASEYAAIFAVVVIALMVCVNILGRNLGRAVQSANAKINGGGAHVLATGPAGGPAAGSDKEFDAKFDECVSGDESACVRPMADEIESTPHVRSSRADQSPDSAAARANDVRRVLSGNQSRTNPNKN